MKHYTSGIQFSSIDHTWVDDAGLVHTGTPPGGPMVHTINRYSPRRGAIEGLGALGDCGCGCNGRPGGCVDSLAGFEENKQTLIGMGVMGVLLAVSLGVVYFTVKGEKR